MKQQVYIIIGPNSDGIDVKKLEYKEAYKKHGIDLIAYGDGKNQVNIAKLKLPPHARVMISAHGNINAGKHQMLLYSPFFGSGTDYTAYHFQSLGNSTNNEPVHAEVMSCYGGYSKYDLQHLPLHSTLMTFIDNKHTSYVGYGSALIKKSAEFSPDNQFLRFASYIMTNGDATSFGINTIKGTIRIEFDSIKNLENFSEQKIKNWQKEKIREFSRFLEDHKNYIAEFYHNGIDDFQLMAKNEVELERFINNFDTKKYQSMLLSNLINQNNLKAIEVFLKTNKNYDINSQVLIGGSSPLGLASTEANSPELVRLLIEKGAKIYTAGYGNGEDSLYYAAKNRQTEMFELLSSQSLKEGYTPLLLHRAVKEGDLKTIKFLLHKNIRIDRYDNSGTTALGVAISNGNLEIAKLLIDYGATPLDQEYADILKRMGYISSLKASSLVSSLKAHNLAAAIWSKNPSMIKLLLGTGAYNEEVLAEVVALFPQNDEIQIYKSDSLAYVLANTQTPLSKIRSLNNLLENTSDLNLQNTYTNKLAEIIATNGTSTLIEAALKGDLKTVRLLLDNGLDVNTIEAQRKESILHLAILSNNKELVEFLLKKGADIKAITTSNSTILHYAIQAPDLEITKLILSKDLNVNAQEKSHNTPLHQAIEVHNFAAIKLLIKHGANTNLINKYGDSPLSLAISMKQTSAIKTILATGAVSQEILLDKKIANDPEVKLYISDPVAYILSNNKEEPEDIIKPFLQATQNRQNIKSQLNSFTKSERILDYISKHTDIAKLLIEEGMDVNHHVGPQRLFNYAVANNNFELVTYLSENKADMNEEGLVIKKYGKDEETEFGTPLQLAMHYNNFKMFQFLLEQGAFISPTLLILTASKEKVYIETLLATGVCNNENLLTIQHRALVKAYLTDPLAYVLANNKDPQDQIKAVNNLIKHEQNKTIKASYQAKLAELAKPQSLNAVQPIIDLNSAMVELPSFAVANQLANNLSGNNIAIASLQGIDDRNYNQNYVPIKYETSAEQIIRNLSAGLAMLAVVMRAFGIKTKLPTSKINVNIDSSSSSLGDDLQYHYLSQEAIENVPLEWKNITKEIIEIAKTADVAEWSQEKWQNFIKDSKNLKLIIETAAKEAEERKKNSRPLTQQDIMDNANLLRLPQQKESTKGKAR